MEEIYVPIKGYEKAYEVSNMGNIRSKRKPRRRCEKILKPQLMKAGYFAIDLGDGTSIKRHLIHRLVAESFIPNPLNKEQVNHINGIKGDNRLENLEWNTRSENQLHSIRAGLRSAKGEKNSQSKLDSKKVIEIFKDKRVYKFIAEQYNINISTVSSIKTKTRWNHVTHLL